MEVYEQITDQFSDYVEFCRNAIQSLGYVPELQGKIAGVTDAMRGKNLRDIDAIIATRDKLIDIKVDHTRRVVDDIMRVAEKIGFNADFRKVLEVTALLHDIGRFEYATWNNQYGEFYANKGDPTSYSDQEAAKQYFSGDFAGLREILRFKGHAQAGDYLLEKGTIKSLLLYQGLAKVVRQAVLHHQDSKLTGTFDVNANRIDDRLLNMNINDVLFKASGFNEAEEQISAVLTQLIKDVDCLDILYQHVTGEFPVIRPAAPFNKDLRDISGKVIEKRSVAEFAKQWGFSPEEVIKYNKLTPEQAEEKAQLTLQLYDYANQKWLIDPSKLVMPQDLQEKFFNLERIDLQEINKRYDWNPIVGMWWRLLQFLGNISLTSNLEVVKENDLLEKIYATYPEEAKPAVAEAFKFAKEKLLNGRGNDIYTTNPFTK